MSGVKAKITGAGDTVKAKYAQQQTGAHGMGVKDRWRVARGDNVRWEQTRAQSQSLSELDEDYAAGGSGVRHRLPPPPPGGTGRAGNNRPPPSRGAGGSAPSPPARGGVPPPPARGGAAAPPPPARNGAAAPPPPARSGAAAPPLPSSAKPPLPLRMNNEAGIDNPPPPYAPSHPSSTTSTSSFAPVRTYSPAAESFQGEGHIEFSKFKYSDKRQFFALLDEYFASKGANVSPA